MKNQIIHIIYNHVKLKLQQKLISDKKRKTRIYTVSFCGFEMNSHNRTIVDTDSLFFHFALRKYLLQV
jgi:hypothetical protein